MSEPDQASKTTLALATRTYSAHQVTEAIGISADMLTNYLTKTKISLCSQPPGQGRPRAFCYVDVLQLKLLASFVDLTGKAEWSARALEYRLFQEVTLEDYRSLTLDVDEGPAFQKYKTGRTKEERVTHINHLRGQFCADVTKAPAIYWARSTWRHWFLFANRFDIESGQFKIREVRSDDVDAIGPIMFSGYFLNATQTLDFVDSRLAQLIEGDRG